MKHAIDPTVDCVFKKLLGSEENSNLLVHFLNAVMQPAPGSDITQVEILNPYNEKDFLTGKLSIVDVKARDGMDRTFKVEIQLSVYGSLKSRILYCWSDLYAAQLKQGEDYSTLKPVIAIWLIAEKLFKDSDGFHYHFKVYEPHYGMVLHEDCAIHVLELKKFGTPEITSELEPWLTFFKEGRQLDYSALPDYMDTAEMRQAMETLKLFSEKERNYHIYQSRMDAIRVQKTLDRERQILESDKQRLSQALSQANIQAQQLRQADIQAENEKEAALKREEAALWQKEAALKREKALMQKLKELGITVDTAEVA